MTPLEYDLDQETGYKMDGGGVVKRYSMTQVFMGLGCAMVATPDGNYVLHSEAQAEIDALKAQRDALLAAQQWQPIESAPSDEVLFLHNKAMGLSGVGYLNSYLDFWSWSYSSNPTHWQPLPPPPEAKARGDRV